MTEKQFVIALAIVLALLLIFMEELVYLANELSRFLYERIIR